MAKRVSLRQISLGRLAEQLKKVEDELAGIQKGDTVAVYWIDASTSDHVNISREIPNHNVETKRINERYIFLGVQKGSEHGDPHILLLRGSLDSEADSTITSLPIYLVKRIVKIGGKLPESIEKSFTESKTVKVVVRKRRIITFPDGSVKYFD